MKQTQNPETTLQYTLERIDNATILTDEKSNLKVAALDEGAEPNANLKSMLGEWITEDVRDATEDFMITKVKLTLLISPINK